MYTMDPGEIGFRRGDLHWVDRRQFISACFDVSGRTTCINCPSTETRTGKNKTHGDIENYFSVS